MDFSREIQRVQRRSHGWTVESHEDEELLVATCQGPGAGTLVVSGDAFSVVRAIFPDHRYQAKMIETGDRVRQLEIEFANEPPTLILNCTALDRVKITGNDPSSHINLEPSRTFPNLDVTSCSVEILDSNPPTSARMTNASIGKGITVLEELVVVGEFSSTQEVSVSNLHLIDAKITAPKSALVAARTKISGSLHVGRSTSVTCHETLEAVPGTDVEMLGKLIVERCSDLQVSGFGTLTVLEFCSGLRSTGDSGAAPGLIVANHGLAREISGRWRIVDVRESMIEGRPGDPFTIVGLTTAPKAADAGESALRDVSLRDFVVPVGLPGLRILGEIEAASTVAIPAVSDTLPGMRAERLKSKNSEVMARTNDSLRADYAALLANVGATKGAPGSRRTRLAWLDYRMKLATTSSGAERWSLHAYRLIGFGERPLPAFGTYMVLAAVLSLGSFVAPVAIEPDSVRDWFRIFLEWLGTPVHLLRLTTTGNEATQLGDGWFAFYGRIALAIPFVTGVLAFRNYLKRG